MKRLTLAATTALLLSACTTMEPAGDMSAAPTGIDVPQVAEGTLSEQTMKTVTESPWPKIMQPKNSTSNYPRNTNI